jgi:hypothetical protein
MLRLLSSVSSGYIAIFWLFVTTTNAAVDDIICRYTAPTPSVVNNYICQDFSDYYGISLEKFFQLNPFLNTACDNIESDTEYCVAGCMLSLYLLI